VTFLLIRSCLAENFFARNFDNYLLKPLSRNNFGTPKGFRWDLVEDPGTKMEWQTVVDSHWKQEFKKISKSRLDEWEISNLFRNTSSRNYVNGCNGNPSFEICMETHFERRHLLGPAGFRIDLSTDRFRESHLSRQADTELLNDYRLQRLEALWTDIETCVQSRKGKRYRRLVPDLDEFSGYVREDLRVGQVPDFIDIFEEEFLDELRRTVNETKSSGRHVELAPDNMAAVIFQDATDWLWLEPDNDRYCVCGESSDSRNAKPGGSRCKSCSSAQGEYE